MAFPIVTLGELELLCAMLEAEEERLLSRDHLVEAYRVGKLHAKMPKIVAYAQLFEEQLKEKEANDVAVQSQDRRD